MGLGPLPWDGPKRAGQRVLRGLGEQMRDYFKNLHEPPPLQQFASLLTYVYPTFLHPLPNCEFFMKPYVQTVAFIKLVRSGWKASSETHGRPLSSDVAYLYSRLPPLSLAQHRSLQTCLVCPLVCACVLCFCQQYSVVYRVQFLALHLKRHRRSYQAQLSSCLFSPRPLVLAIHTRPWPLSCGWSPKCSLPFHTHTHTHPQHPQLPQPLKASGRISLGPKPEGKG